MGPGWQESMCCTPVSRAGTRYEPVAEKDDLRLRAKSMFSKSGSVKTLSLGPLAGLVEAVPLVLQGHDHMSVTLRAV